MCWEGDSFPLHLLVLWGQAVQLRLFYVSSAEKDNVASKKYLQNLIDINYQDPQIYSYMSNILLDEKDNELDMGTGFDEFSSLSFHGTKYISKTATKNRLILLGIMTCSGWDFFRNEWWHYQLFNSKKYPLLGDEDLKKPLTLK